MIGACIIFVAWLFLMDYTNLSWSNNKSAYLGIVVSALIVVNMFMSNKQEKAKKKINLNLNHS